MKIPQVIAEAVLMLLHPYAERTLSLEDIETFLSHSQEQDKNEKLLSRKETAEALRISLPTLDRMLRDGQISKRMLRGRVLIPQSEVDRVMNTESVHHRAKTI